MGTHQGILRQIIERVLIQRAAQAAADQYNSGPWVGHNDSVYSYLRARDRMVGQPRTTGADPNTTSIVHQLPRGYLHSA
jgi:hypothetical protein